jgi:phage terminase Nu1 subunit (DNA packaging protein)
MAIEHYSTSRLADEFGFDRRTVTKRISSVKPVRTERQKKYYLIKDVAPYLVDFPDDDGLDYHGQRTRLTKLQADKLDREEKIAEGQLLETQAVLEWVKRGDQRVKSKLLALPSRCAPLVVGQKTTEIENILDGIIYECLSELSDVSEMACCQKNQKQEISK